MQPLAKNSWTDIDSACIVTGVTMAMKMAHPEPFNVLAWIDRVTEPVARGLIAWLPSSPATAFVEAWLGQMLEVALLVALSSIVLAWLRYRLGARWLLHGLGRADLIGALSGALLGMLTPVCACGVGAVYASLLENGASPRAAGAFLFAAPATNEVVLLVLLFIVGPGGALLYLACGLVAAVATGHLAPRLGMTSRAHAHHDGDGAHARGGGDARGDTACPTRAPLWRAMADTKLLLRRLAVPVSIGAAAAVALDRWPVAPADLLGAMAHAWFTPIVAAVVGLPLHVEPGLMGGMVFGLVSVGLPLGTVISLTMAASVASVPEALVLRSVMGLRAVARLGVWYLLYTSAIGLLVNAIWRP